MDYVNCYIWVKPCKKIVFTYKNVLDCEEKINYKKGQWSFIKKYRGRQLDHWHSPVASVDNFDSSQGYDRNKLSILKEMLLPHLYKSGVGKFFSRMSNWQNRIGQTINILNLSKFCGRSDWMYMRQICSAW